MFASSKPPRLTLSLSPTNATGKQTLTSVRPSWHDYAEHTGRNLSALVRTAVESEIARDPIGTNRPSTDVDPDWWSDVTGSEPTVSTSSTEDPESP